MARLLVFVLLGVTSAIGQTGVESTARVPLSSVQRLTSLCTTQGEVGIDGGMMVLSDVGPVTHQYITVANDSMRMKFIREEWNHYDSHRVAIAQVIIYVLPNGSVADASCNRILESDSGDVLELDSSACADPMVQETLDSMTDHFSNQVK